MSDKSDQLAASRSTLFLHEIYHEGMHEKCTSLTRSSAKMAAERTLDIIHPCAVHPASFMRQIVIIYWLLSKSLRTTWSYREQLGYRPYHEYTWLPRRWDLQWAATIFLPDMRIGAYRLRRGKVAIFAYSSSWPAPFCDSSVQQQKTAEQTGSSIKQLKPV